MPDTPSGRPEAPEPTVPVGEPTTEPAPAEPGPAEPTTDPGAPAPEQVTPTLPVPAPAAQPDTRPRPEFGEYAPEGWEWKPEGDDAAPSSGTSVGATPQRPGAGRPAAAGTVQGVPHNLGSGIARPSRKSAPKSAAAAPSSGEPYRAQGSAQPAAPRQAQQFQPPAQGMAGYQKPPNMADRIITILLLVFGGFGALQSAFAMMGMSTMFKVMEDAPGISALTPPAWLDLTGKITGMVLLVLYGLVLVYSIRRLRARKLTFWAPLAAAMLAFIVVVTIVAAAMVQTPELMEVMRDPQASTELLNYLQGFPSN